MHGVNCRKSSARQRCDREPDVEPAYLAKQKDKPLRSPLIVVVVASLIVSPKIPEIEQMLSAGAAAHNILLASNALGFGSIWLTGANAYDALVCGELGLDPKTNASSASSISARRRLNYMPRPIPEVSRHHSEWK